ncbi:hypothetical protein Daus18300_004541 [Diaporthe australafricana]|uniref:Endoglucanase n=1 Tax=Diaporthe australafricana TaxID=127596 RepID=A0ABR3X7K3_9PEZI
MAATQRLQLAMAFLCLLFAQLCIANELLGRHIELVTPQPFVFDEFGPTNPLKADGSDYPCKVPQGESFKIASAATEMVIGENQTVSFNGTAVHGGGSCQFALADGLEPTKDTPWKVIHSVEGGCPKANIEGNLQDGQSPDEYTFTIPDDFAPGEYTFAWTWVNRIGGQPEFYMNCAPVSVKAGAGSTRAVKERRMAQGKRQSTYPDLFLANIGDTSNGCDTSEALTQQVAIQYPSPGDSVSFPNGEDGLFKQACDGNARNNGGGGSGGSGGSAASATGARPSATRGGAGGSAPPSASGQTAAGVSGEAS